MIQDGWLSEAVHLSSPNFNERPQPIEINLLIIHNISLPPGRFGGGHIQAFFLNQLDANSHAYFKQIRDLQVSAHCLIERSGEVTQFVSFNDRAWHAGKSEFSGVADCNDYSIGIELEGTDNLTYAEIQYLTLADLTAQIMTRYPKITKDRIVGHCDVSPGRKTDPGAAFDWLLFRELLEKKISQ